jgi:hypothetical protein
MISPEQFEHLLPLACAWAEENERHILASGHPLSASQMQDAAAARVKHPERVRLMPVQQIPTPSQPDLALAAELTGLISPLTGGMTLRYGIWVRDDCWNNRPLIAHELVHVHQYERMGGFDPFLRQYLWECLHDGYPGGAMEQEAVAGAARIIEGG